MEKVFILIPKKLAVGNQPVKTRISGIWKLAVGAHLPKLDPPIWETRPSGFSWFSEIWSVCGYCVSLISLGYLGFCWEWDFIDNLCSIPLDRATYLYPKLNLKYISSTWACTRWLLPLHLFLTSWGLPHLILFWHWLLRGCDLGYFKSYNQFPLLISKSLYILIQ
jgi:hypothetical protein